MVMDGETIATGASPKCSDCGVVVYLDVYRSFAGYYVGAWCDCGPYSRESGYYSSSKDAQQALDTGRYER